ncbi:MAG: SDR family oxidoreductase [Puniceicoccaceae bacterium]|nr:MAG: SDR family oxidoreductase [Puniceicoccaceae bacterium]
MNLSLENRKCVVMGGSRGIGRAIALGLAAEGAGVAVCARGEGPLRAIEEELRRHGRTVHAGQCDLADEAALEAFLHQSREKLGGLDVLVHNASALALGPERKDWEASFRVDMMGAVRAVDQVVPWMEATGGGSILFIASISGLEAFPMADYSYSAMKAGLIAYAKKLAVLLGSKGIRVNAIAPGSIEFAGGVWDQAKQHQPDFYEAVRGGIPAGRMGTPEEVADVAVFLASPRSGWINGECISVDGAQHRGMR